MTVGGGQVDEAVQWKREDFSVQEVRGGQGWEVEIGHVSEAGERVAPQERFCSGTKKQQHGISGLFSSNLFLEEITNQTNKQTSTDQAHSGEIIAKRLMTPELLIEPSVERASWQPSKTYVAPQLAPGDQCERDRLACGRNRLESHCGVNWGPRSMWGDHRNWRSLTNFYGCRLHQKQSITDF